MPILHRHAPESRSLLLCGRDPGTDDALQINLENAIKLFNGGSI